jgi:hypothetical protein
LRTKKTDLRNCERVGRRAIWRDRHRCDVAIVDAFTQWLIGQPTAERGPPVDVVQCLGERGALDGWLPARIAMIVIVVIWTLAFAALVFFIVNLIQG